MWLPRLRHAVVLLPLAVLVACDVPRHAPQQPRHAQQVRFAAPEPVIVTRHAWHAADDAVRDRPHLTGPVDAVFIHHTDNPNDYDCRRDVPAMLRSMELSHVDGMGWDDLGYNFVVDRCGTIYEGRAGGVARPVRGAHTKGFNDHTVGIAALGTFDSGARVPKPMLEAIAAVAAWKLAPGVNPTGSVTLVSSSDESRFPKGTPARMDVISGHRDAYETDCPGQALYDDLPWLRRRVAQLRHDASVRRARAAERGAPGGGRD